MIPWTAAYWASLSITNSRSSSKPMSIESVMPSTHFIFCHPCILLSSIFPSIKVFSNESVLPFRSMYWSFSFSISTSNEYSGLISFRMDWLISLQAKGLPREYTILQLLKSYIFNQNTKPTENPSKCSKEVELSSELLLTQHIF